jgi:hypothetical protein
MAGKNWVLLTFAGDATRLKKAFDEVGDGAKKMDGQLDESGGKFGKWKKLAVGAAVAVGAAAIAAGVDAFHLSQDLSKMDAKAAAVFEGQLSSVQSWADANKAAFGLTNTQVVGLAASMADLLKPMGFTAEQATSMSQDLLGLSGALADWSGGTHDAAAVSEILSKALLGEREQLKSLGISISEADVQARLASKGQSDLTGEALAQAKAVATQELIMEKSTDAQKAWANGGKEAAEAQNASKVTMQELRESLARGLTPAFEAGTAIVSKFAGWAEKNQGTVKVLAGVLGSLVAVVLVVSAVTKVAAAFQVIWNIAMLANPIGLIILAIVALVAIVIIAYKKSDTFRAIVQGAFRAVGKAVSWLGDRFADWWHATRSVVDRAAGIFRGLPGRIGSAFRGLFNIITGPFRAAFNFVASAWNNTVGRLRWSIPGWVPGIGGNSISAPTLPQFHTGGTASGGMGREFLAVLRAGETVSPVGGGGGGGELVIRSGGAQIDDLLVQILARAVSARGGLRAALGPGAL